jgi:hypothetical protein
VVLKPEPFLISLPWKMLKPKIKTRSRVVLGIGVNGASKKIGEEEKIHLGL